MTADGSKYIMEITPILYSVSGQRYALRPVTYEIPWEYMEVAPIDYPYTVYSMIQNSLVTLPTMNSACNSAWLAFECRVSNGVTPAPVPDVSIDVGNDRDMPLPQSVIDDIEKAESGNA